MLRSRRCASISDGLFARMGRGCGNHRCDPAGRRAQASRLSRIGGRLRHVELEVAGGGDARRAEIAQAPGIGGGLRQAEVEAAQQRRDGGGRAAPAVERALGQPAVDQEERHAARGRRGDQVGPQIGFDEQRQIGLPMIEEPLDEARRIERHELVDRTRGQPLLGQRRRRHCARGAQHVEFPLADALDQRDDGEQFADTGAMHPDQRARRARDLAFTVALAQTGRDPLCRV